MMFRVIERADFITFIMNLSVARTGQKPSQLFVVVHCAPLQKKASVLSLGPLLNTGVGDFVY